MQNELSRTPFLNKFCYIDLKINARELYFEKQITSVVQVSMHLINVVPSHDGWEMKLLLDKFRSETTSYFTNKLMFLITARQRERCCCEIHGEASITC
jgi:hypothetical protein